MKTTTVWVFFLITTSFTAIAQNHLKERKEEIKLERRSFIEQFVGFSDQEAEKFWKLEDEMLARLKEIRKNIRQGMIAIKKKGIDNISDDELKREMEKGMKYEQKILDVRKEYLARFIDLVGAKKTAKYYQADREFRKKLLRKLRESGREESPNDLNED